MGIGSSRSFVAAALLAVGIGMVSCGGQAGTSSGSTSSPAASPAASASQATTGNAEAIHLVLTGGPGAGTFDFKSSKPCASFKTPKFLQGTYGDKSPTSGRDFILSVQTANSPATFTFSWSVSPVGADPNAQGYIYQISTDPQLVDGSGSVDFQELGLTARMSINGKTKEGYGVVATVQCNQITRPQG